MVNSHMACGIVKDDLMVPVGRTGTLPAWARGAQEMDFTMSIGIMIVVGSEVDESPLDGWVRARRGGRAVTATQGEQRTPDSTGAAGPRRAS
jgi:hypothetical protein